jgi:hypothetical protein
MLREESWNRSNFFWGMFRFRRRNATWVASSGFVQQSMIESESNQMVDLYSRLSRTILTQTANG